MHGKQQQTKGQAAPDIKHMMAAWMQTTSVSGSRFEISMRLELITSNYVSTVPRVTRESPVMAAHARGHSSASSRTTGKNMATYTARVVWPEGNEHLSTLTVASMSSEAHGS